MTDVAHADARVNSLFEPGFTAEDRVLMDAKGLTATPGVLPEAPPVEIHNGRELQTLAAADRCFSEAAFFEEHSFVLLDHASGVQNWDTDPTAAPDDNEVASIYYPEIATIVRERLLPGYSLEIPRVPYLLRRGPETANPFYGTAVHQDYGLSADDYEENVAAYGTDEAAAAWRKQYDRDEVTGFLVINFWRTVYMDEPLRHLPLTICDPYSVEPDDVHSTGLVNFTPTGRPSNQLGMRYNPKQRWYYYPRMTTGEVVAFEEFPMLEGASRRRFESASTRPSTSPTRPSRRANGRVATTGSASSSSTTNSVRHGIRPSHPKRPKRHLGGRYRRTAVRRRRRHARRPHRRGG